MSTWDHPFSATGFNDLVKLVARSRPQGGRNTRIGEKSSRGAGVHYNPQVETHPWKVSPFWHQAKKKWCAEIEPGFVNGHDPAVYVDKSDLPGGARVYGNEYGRTSVAKGGGELQVLLTDAVRPFLVLNTFNTSDTGVMAPDFFAPWFDDESNSSERILRQIDIVLTIDKPAVTSINGPVEGVIGNVPVGYSITPPGRTRRGARLTSVGEYRPVERHTSIQDRLAGTYDDPDYETIQIARIYFLSPLLSTKRNTSGDAVDGDWHPFVRHYVFWNLRFQTLSTVSNDRPQALTLTTGLLFGTADTLFMIALDPVNRADALTAAAFSSTSFEGKFWTAG